MDMTPFGPERQPVSLPVTIQTSPIHCVASCVDMLLPRRSVTLVENHRLGERGTTTADMVLFVDDNLAAEGFTTKRGTIAEAIASSKRFIAIVDQGHAVVVEGVRSIRGIEYVVVRDPAVGPYMERLDWFVDQRVVQDVLVLGFPAIWGE